MQGTWPTGIQAPLMDHGKFECLDYCYVWQAPGYQVKCVATGQSCCVLLHMTLASFCQYCQCKGSQ